jgi:hypothetical protein
VNKRINRAENKNEEELNDSDSSVVMTIADTNVDPCDKFEFACEILIKNITCIDLPIIYKLFSETDLASFHSLTTVPLLEPILSELCHQSKSYKLISLKHMTAF